MTNRLTDEALAAFRWRAKDHVTDRHGDRDALLAEVDRLQDINVEVTVDFHRVQLELDAAEQDRDEARELVVEFYDDEGITSEHVERYRAELAR